MKTIYVLLLLVIANALILKANPDVSLVKPDSGATKQPLNTSIMLTTTGRILSDSLYQDSPYAHTTTAQVLPNILVVKTKDYLEQPDSLIKNYGVQVKIYVIDTNTINIVPSFDLSYNTTYTILVKRLYVKSNSDTFNLSKTFNYAFTTIDLPPYFVHSNLPYSAAVRCTDTLRLQVRGAIDTDMMPLSSLVSVFRLDSVAHLDTLHVQPRLSEISINRSLSSDKKTLEITATNGFEPYKQYYVQYKLAEITGDTLDNRLIEFTGRSSSRVTVNARMEHSSDTIPNGLEPFGKGILNVYNGDTVRIFAPDTFGVKYRFLHWVCGEDTTYNNVTDNELKLTANCSTFKDMSISAVYEKVCMDTIRFSTEDHINSYRVTGYTDSLNADTYTLSRIDTNRTMYVEAVPESGYYFSNYTLSDTTRRINAEMSSYMMKIRPQSNSMPCGQGTNYVGLHGGLLPTYPCDQLSFCVFLHRDYDQLIYGMPFTENLADIFKATVNRTPVIWENNNVNEKVKCYYYSASPSTKLVTVLGTVATTMTECFEISYFYATDGQHAGDQYYTDAKSNQKQNPIGINFDERQFMLQNPTTCNIECHIYIRKKAFNLIVDYTMKDGKYLPWVPDQAILINQVDINGHELANGRKATLTTITSTTNTCYGEQRLVTFRKTYRYPCGTYAQFYPSVKSPIYSLDKWLCESEVTPDDPTIYCTTSANTTLCSVLSTSASPASSQHVVEVLMNQNRRIVYQYMAGFHLEEFIFPKAHGVISNDGYKHYKLPGSTSSADPLPDDIKTPVAGMGVEITFLDRNYAAASTLPWPTNIALSNKVLRQNYHRNTTKIGYVFSDKVNLNSLLGGNCQVWDGGGAVPIDPSHYVFNRHDKLLGTCYSYFQGEKTNGGYWDTNPDAHNIFKLYLYDYADENKRQYACHYETQTLRLTNSVISEGGEQLANPIGDGDGVPTIHIQTDVPDIYMFVNNFYVANCDGSCRDNCIGSDCPDPYVLAYTGVTVATESVVNNIEQVSLTTAGSKYWPADGVHQDVQGIVDISQNYLILKDLTQTSKVTGSFVVGDEGYYNKDLEGILTTAAQIIIPIAADWLGLGTTGSVALEKLVELGIKSFKIMCNDRLITKFSIWANEQNYWSGDPFSPGDNESLNDGFLYSTISSHIRGCDGLEVIDLPIWKTHSTPDGNFKFDYIWVLGDFQKQ